MGHSAWTPPKLFSWDTWIAQQWQRALLSGSEDRVLLTPAQEHRIWRRAIEAEGSADGLISLDAIAETAARAARLLAEWDTQDQFTRIRSHADTDSALFARWLQRFERECVREQWISVSQSSKALAVIVGEASEQIHGDEFFLSGFDRILPSQQILLNALTQSGATISHAALAGEPSTISIVAAIDDDAEIHACASWIAKKLCDSDGNIGILVPDLDASREKIDRIFRSTFAPWSIPFTEAAAAPFEFSLGRPLSSATMVKDALLLLQWTQQPLGMEDVSRLLLSPYLGSEEEIQARAAFDAHLLRRGHRLTPELDLSEAIGLFSKAEPIAVRGFSINLQAMHSHATAPRTETWSTWCQHARDLLSAFGWPGPRPADSREFQLLKRWEMLLEETSVLDLTEERVTWGTALATLERAAAGTLFNMQSRGERVQIMGPLEAAGHSFEALWFLHADQSRWPMPRSSNPLLPWTLQQQSGMPGSSAEIDFEFAANVTRRIAASASDVVFSHAEDGAYSGRQSSLMEIFPTAATHPLTAPLHVEETNVLEEVADDSPIPQFVSHHIHGGARVIELQAACAFRAFAEQRLFSVEPEEVDAGMNALERGNTVHKVLELFWKKTTTQVSLKHLSATYDPASGRTQRDLRLEECIVETLQNKGTRWERAYLAIEHKRLHALLSQWLEMECKRPVPFTVLHTEKVVENAALGSLRLNLRVDRVDQLHVTGNGPDELLLIDYKTGLCSVAEWSGARPDKPQLPLYAVASEFEHVGGVAFGSVRAGDDTLWLKGVTQTANVFSTSKSRASESDFNTQREEWYFHLLALAESFAAGDASVSPKRYPSTCQRCTQRILCRVDGAKLASSDAVTLASSSVDEAEDLL